ncbi:MAG TPA: ribose-phosphate diphosphokinase [Frateuria sp.]|uniref:ribose-phosphate diphosphokinase n=1 Tax=Frateuria sp. TaxID=2211372 RepID=UPI002D7EA223|nr:ribose-phosphate diphosphokinase [Frateuria sp.]HET6805517.1 ribose-phosphate diphosphokinase [Frateuria sp.]
MSLLYALPGNAAFARALCRHAGWQRGELELHRFPDGESLLRLATPPRGTVALACSLKRPDAKLFPLLAAAATARELGATQVGLVAPYLAYMRQDVRFHPGEAVSARVIGGLLGNAFDWVVTVDPHLHRIHDLAEVFACRTSVVHAAPELAAWIRAHVREPLLVGPDTESAQWVQAVADALGAPCVVAHKQRRGDRDVSVRLPSLARWRGHTPVLLDDIAASGHTLIDTARGVREQLPQPAPVAVVVHGLLGRGALEALHGAGIIRLVTTNTVPGELSAIDVSARVAQAMAALGAAGG